jgi:hypothetical protein
MSVTHATAKPPSAVTQAVSQFIDGAIHGARGDTSVAQALGDIVASSIPGYGQGRAFGDVWDGIKTGNTAQVVAGLIGLVPMAGGATKSVVDGGKRAAAIAGAEVAEKGMSAAALNFSRVAGQTVKKTAERLAKDPAVREQLAKAGERAYGRTMELLQEKLLTMAAEGKTPDVTVREHDGFIDARKAAFGELEGAPDKTWQSLFAPDDARGKKVVGKHKPVPQSADIEDQVSTRGFRFIEPDQAPASGEKGEYGLMWWKQPDREADPVFGIESFQASPGEAAKIFDAYLNSTKTFGRVKTAAT